MCTIGGTKTWHRNANDTFTIEIQLIESFDGDKQGQRRVKSATDANDSFLCIDVVETFGESCHLDVQNLLTGRMHILILWNKRMGIDGTLQFKVAFLNGFAGYLQSMGMTLCIDERGVLTALYTQLLYIDLILLDLG